MNTIPQRIAAAAQPSRDVVGPKEFAMLVRYLMLADGSPGGAIDFARFERAPSRVINAIDAMHDPMPQIRAAQDPLSLASSGSVLSPYQLLRDSFLLSLQTATAFDALLPSMVRMPPRRRVVAVTSAITGATVAEFSAKPVSSLALAASDLDILKTAGQIVISAEALRFGGEGALQYLQDQLRIGVAAATDTQFFVILAAAATSSFSSSGGNASGARLDIRAMLQALTIGSASRLFLLVHPDIAVALAVLGDSQGGPAFLSATFSGGSIGGIKVVPSDQCPAQTMFLVDAAGLAGFSEDFRVDTTRHGTPQTDTSPDSPAVAGTNVQNLWQLDQVGAKCERYFSCMVVRSGSVSRITNANFTGGSPS